MIRILKLTFIVFFLKISFLEAEIVKPNSDIKPVQVVKIQLKGLMKNDSPYKDKGIEQTWEFAHPNNKIFTGPINRFKEMLKGESYKMLIDHTNHEIKEIYLNDELAIFEVTVMDNDKKYFKFKWQVEKYLNDGPLENCWLTTVVSQPLPLGEAI
tara:strand:- start:253 stop:717 length:465 start_codon:yes stop_codon:yes gene_type:complete